MQRILQSRFAVPIGRWFDVRFENVEGRHGSTRVFVEAGTVKLDGEVINEYVEPESARKPPGADGKYLSSGALAIQSLTGVVRYKDIQIKMLD